MGPLFFILRVLRIFAKSSVGAYFSLTDRTPWKKIMLVLFDILVQIFFQSYKPGLVERLLSKIVYWHFLSQTRGFEIIIQF